MNLDDCIISTRPKTKAGYAVLKLGKRLVYHHRYVLAKKLGKELHELDGLDARHKCDRPACINPDHLELGTRQDNVDDMLARGRANYAVGEQASKAKLTATQVLEIRAAKTTSCLVLAAKYGVSHTAVLKIWRGESWKHLTGDKHNVHA
jgi:hypothetical protein